MKISLVKVVGMLALFVGLVGFVNAQTNDETPQPITVKSLIASEMPINIEFVTVTKLEGKSVLTYSIANKNVQKLDAVDILVIVFSADGYARGGEGWRQRLDLAKDANADFSMQMKTEVVPEDRVVFLIHKAEGQAGQWEVDSTRLVKAAKAFVAGNTYSLPQPLFSKTK